MNRLFRLFLVLGAAVFGGLLVYALTGNLAWKWGETAATIWFVLCVFVSGYLAHRLLPPPKLSDLLTEEDIVVSFDAKLFINAMGCTSNKTFDVWKRSP